MPRPHSEPSLLGHLSSTALTSSTPVQASGSREHEHIPPCSSPSSPCSGEGLPDPRPVNQPQQCIVSWDPFALRVHSSHTPGSARRARPRQHGSVATCVATRRHGASQASQQDLNRERDGNRAAAGSTAQVETPWEPEARTSDELDSLLVRLGSHNRISEDSRSGRDGPAALWEHVTSKTQTCVPFGGQQPALRRNTSQGRKVLRCGESMHSKSQSSEEADMLFYNPHKACTLATPAPDPAASELSLMMSKPGQQHRQEVALNLDTIYSSHFFQSSQSKRWQAEAVCVLPSNNANHTNCSNSGSDVDSDGCMPVAPTTSSNDAQRLMQQTADPSATMNMSCHFGGIKEWRTGLHETRETHEGSHKVADGVQDLDISRQTMSACVVEDDLHHSAEEEQSPRVSALSLLVCSHV
jgi:hypothetical protein